MKFEIKNLKKSFDVNLILFFSFFFLIAFGLGFALIYNSGQSLQSIRDPAAYQKQLNQLKTIDPERLKAELLNKMEVQTLANGDKVFRFINLSSNICSQYKKIKLHFFAEGISESGESPTMTIQADCLPAQDPVELASIFIPVSKILKEKPADAEFKFDQVSSSFSFKQSGSEWPRLWILKSLVFLNESGPEKTVAFDRRISSESKPTVLEF